MATSEAHSSAGQMDESTSATLRADESRCGNNEPGRHDDGPADAAGQHRRRRGSSTHRDGGQQAPQGRLEGAVAEHRLEVLRHEHGVAHDAEHPDDLHGDAAAEAAVAEERQVDHR